MGDAVAYRLHHTGRFDAEAVGQPHRVEPRTEVGVGEVEADGFVPDAHLARPGVADGHLLPGEDVRATGFVEADGVCHRKLPRGFVGWGRGRVRPGRRAA